MKCPTRDSNNDISPTFSIIFHVRFLLRKSNPCGCEAILFTCTHRYKLVQNNMCDVFLTFYPNKYTLHGKQNIDKK